MKLVALMIMLACATSAAVAPAEEKISAGGLQIHAFRRYVMLSPAGEGNRATSVIDLVVLIENVGRTEITLPTLPEGKKPTGASWYAHRITRFSFDVETWYGRKVLPPPSRFEPITLRPGEMVRLQRWTWTTYAEEEEKLTRDFVVYSVSQELSSKYGWWSGDLVVEAKKEPNKLP